MNEEANHLIRFAVQWAPFGGCDEEIFPRFGITPATFYLRVLELLRTQPTVSTMPAAEQLTDLCRRKMLPDRRCSLATR